MDSYNVYMAQELLANLMSQAFLPSDRDPGERCIAPKCNIPAVSTFNIRSKKIEPSFCYDCTLKELRKIVSTSLVGKLDDSVTKEVEQKAKTFVAMRDIVLEAEKRNAPNP